MIQRTNLDVVDADAHVIETEHTWDYLEASERKFRPRLFSSPDEPGREYWVIDEKIRGFRFPNFTERQLRELSERSGRKVETPQAAREMADVDLRLRHMDELGIETQVLHNTLWIEQVSQRAEVETALCRSWNRWLADIWEKGGGRLRWSCVIPTLAIDEAIEQMSIAKEHGAVAICIRPIEGDRHMTDPYFYPIYEHASTLNLAIALHIANGNPTNVDLFRGTPANRFAMFRAPTVISCFNFLVSELPSVFPKLRWGFIETCAQWIPWIYNEAVLRHKRLGKAFPEDVFGQYKVFVTCQTDDDLSYVLNYAGERSLVIGTDYGHTDPSSEVDAITVLRQKTNISQETKDRILHYNPKELYDL
ncbi:MAG TPA: amidohydrolase family protein [Candidatus Binatia bacterium]|jgi:predicted TIM-barrel fold metal-dependent hydrolase